ncbi:MAG: F0F1 ATP synthase subunit A [Elusimicrobia bacterium]|nr:F0F1 ATP synthase subunit A [Elusimicrobiota bacterium]
MLKEIIEHHILDHVYAYIGLGAFSLPLSKHLLMMLIVAVGLALVLPWVFRSRLPGMGLARTAVETLVLFIRDGMVIPSMGEEGRKYTPYFCTLFFFILCSNLLGLVPYGATATGNISVTAALALSTFLLINISGVAAHGVGGYLKSFVPHGVPVWLTPFLFVIEIIGLIAKTFALCVRLFANMIGGHIVLLSLIAMIFIFSEINVYAGVFGAIPVAIPMALFISMLEVFVAALQAYIFTFLTAIFTGAALHPH